MRRLILLCLLCTFHYGVAANENVQIQPLQGNFAHQHIAYQEQLTQKCHNNQMQEAEMLQCYTQEIKKDNPEKTYFQTSAALALYYGAYGVTPDHQLSKDLFILAAENGNPVALYYAARIYLAEDNNTKQKIGIDYLAQLDTKFNMPNAQADLGAIYLKGQIVQKDTNKAQILFNKAKDQGCIVGKTFADELEANHMQAEKGYDILNKASINMGLPAFAMHD